MSIEIPADPQPFVAEREETLEGIRQGLADAAAGRSQSLAEAYADLRGEFSLADPA